MKASMFNGQTLRFGTLREAAVPTSVPAAYARGTNDSSPLKDSPEGVWRLPLCSVGQSREAQPPIGREVEVPSQRDAHFFLVLLDSRHQMEIPSFDLV